MGCSRRAALRGLGASALWLGTGACAGRTPAGGPAGLTVSVPWDLDSLDPHARDLVGQFAAGAHLYEPLVRKDPDMALEPCLALRWTNPDPLTWQFVLRPGVRFHDGRALDSADVVHTLERLHSRPELEVGVYASAVESVRAPGPLVVEVRTRRPTAVLLNKLSSVLVVPRSAAGESLADRPCGTGPYRLLEWRRGDRLVMRRHEGHWGRRGPAETATLLLARPGEAALHDLLEGTSQVAHCASKAAEAAIASRKGLRLVRRTGIFLRYLGFDLFRPETPEAPGRPNPFLDRRVRQAVSLAVDRRAYVAGLPSSAVPAGQLAPPGIFGHDPELPELAFDPERARSLLREVGLGGGFEVTLTARALVAQGVGSLVEMLGAVGVRLAVRTLSEPEMFEAVARGPSCFLTRYGCDTGDASDVFEAGMHTVDRERRLGTANVGRWSDPDLDRAIEESAEQLAVGARRPRLQAIMRRVIGDLVWVPLCFDQDVYGVADPWAFRPRADSYVLAAEVERGGA